MVLLTDEAEKEELGFGQNTTIWKRLNSGKFLEEFEYTFVQVIDGAGNEVEPAYSRWIDAQQRGATGGVDPNQNFFRAALSNDFCPG